MTKVFRLLTSFLVAIGCFFLFWQSLSPVKAAVIAVNPGDSIQAAIDAAAPGDTILLNAGRYTESLTLNKAVSLTGVSSATTIIHALPNNTVMTVTGTTIDQGVIISGLMFTGGVVSDGPTFDSGRAGGLAVENGARPVIQHVRFKGMDGNFGFGMIVDQGDPLTFNHVTFEDNFGGGIFSRSDLTLTHAYFENNFSGLIAVDADVSLSDSSMISQIVAISSTNATLNNIYVSESRANELVLFSLHYDGGGPELTSPIDYLWPPYNSTPYKYSGLGPIMAINAVVFHSTFIENAGGLGGVFRILNTIQVSHSSFISNKVVGETESFNVSVDGRGGAIYANQLAEISNSTFENNWSEGNGNGSAIYSEALTKIFDSLFKKNTCDDLQIRVIPCDKGTIVFATEIEIVDSIFDENSSGPFSAIVYGSKIDIVNGTFENNIAGYSPIFLGGYWETTLNSIDEQDLIVKESTFYSNTGWLASGIASDSGSIIIKDSVFFKNGLNLSISGDKKPNAVVWSSNDVVISNSEFLENCSTQPTILIESANDTSLSFLDIKNSRFFRNESIEDPGAIGVYGGYARLSNSIIQDEPAASVAFNWNHPVFGNSPLESALIVENTTISNSLPLTVPAFYSGDTIIITNTIVAGFDLMAEGIGVEEDYNIFTNAPDAHSGIVISGGHSLYETDPLFVDPAAGDFRLQPGSPAIDVGVDLGLTADFAGNPRPGTGSTLHDIGAFEFQGVGRCGVIDCYIYLPLVINSPENS